MTGWSINAAELRIPRRSRFAAHRMIVIGDPKRDAVRQLNGLASWLDPASGGWLHKPIGYLPSDRLRGYDSGSFKCKIEQGRVVDMDFDGIRGL